MHPTLGDCPVMQNRRVKNGSEDKHTNGGPKNETKILTKMGKQIWGDTIDKNMTLNVNEDQEAGQELIQNMTLGIC